MPNTATSNGGFSLSLRTVEQVKLLHQKKASSGWVLVRVRRGWMCSVRPDWDLLTQRLRLRLHPLLPDGHSGVETRRITSEPSSWETNSPPPIFNQLLSRSSGGGLFGDDLANGEGYEDAWAKLNVRSSFPLM